MPLVVMKVRSVISKLAIDTTQPHSAETELKIKQLRNKKLYNLLGRSMISELFYSSTLINYLYKYDRVCTWCAKSLKIVLSFLRFSLKSHTVLQVCLQKPS